MLITYRTLFNATLPRRPSWIFVSPMLNSRLILNVFDNFETKIINSKAIIRKVTYIFLMQLAEQNFEVYLFPYKLLKTIDLAHYLFSDPRYNRVTFIKKQTHSAF